MLTCWKVYRDQISFIGQLQSLSNDYAYLLSGTLEDALLNGAGYSFGSAAGASYVRAIYYRPADVGPPAAGQMENPHTNSGSAQTAHHRRIQKQAASIYDFPGGVEVERLIITLKNLSTRTARLSASPFRRIREDLYKAEQMDDLSLREVNAWWQGLQEDFQRLSQNHQDFLRELYGPGMEMQIKSMDFIVYKQNLVRYPEDFVQGLQHSAEQIGAQLEKFSPEQASHFWVSNKVELRHLLTLFAGFQTVEEGHRLSALVFGAQQARHFSFDHIWESERIGLSPYDEPPMEFPLCPGHGPISHGWTRLCEQKCRKGSSAPKNSGGGACPPSGSRGVYLGWEAGLGRAGHPCLPRRMYSVSGLGGTGQSQSGQAWSNPVWAVLYTEKAEQSDL